MARVTGLEITECAVRVADLDGSPRKYRVQAAGEVPIPEDRRNDSDAVIQAIRAAFKSARAKRDQVIVGIPSQEAVIREIVVPFTDEDQIRKVIKFESEGHLHGVDIEDVVVDFQKVGENGPRSRVLIIAIRKDVVRRYLDILNRAGIDPQQVDLDAAALFSLSRLIPEVEELGDVGQVVLDLGEVTSTVLVSQGEHLRMVRCMRLGSDSLTRRLTQDLGMERSEARTVTMEILKIDDPFTSGDAEAAAASAATSTAVATDVVRGKQSEFEQRVVGEIRRSLSSIQMEGRLGAIWLTGPTSTAPGLERALVEAFGVPVAPLETLQPADHKLPERASLYVGTACGLALKGLGHDPMGLDFRQEELRFTRRFEKIQMPLIIALLLLFLGLAFLSINAWLQFQSRQNLIERSGAQAVNDLEGLMIKPALENSKELEYMGFENKAQVERLIASIKRQGKEVWARRALGALRGPKEKILEHYGIEVGSEESSGPESQVVSALVRLEAFVRAFDRSQKALGYASIHQLNVAPSEIRFTMLLERLSGWDALKKEFAKIPGFESTELGVTESFQGNTFKGSLYLIKNCKVKLERE